jgi:hypothetical protein
MSVSLITSTVTGRPSRKRITGPGTLPLQAVVLMIRPDAISTRAVPMRMVTSAGGPSPGVRVPDPPIACAPPGARGASRYRRRCGRRDQLAAMPDGNLRERLPSLGVLARLSPSQKQRLVDQSQEGWGDGGRDRRRRQRCPRARGGQRGHRHGRDRYGPGQGGSRSGPHRRQLRPASRCHPHRPQGHRQLPQGHIMLALNLKQERLPCCESESSRIASPPAGSWA